MLAILFAFRTSIAYIQQIKRLVCFSALAFACLDNFVPKYLHNFFLKDNSAVIQGECLLLSLEFTDLSSLGRAPADTHRGVLMFAL